MSKQGLLATLAKQVKALAIAVRGLQGQQPLVAGQQSLEAPAIATTMLPMTVIGLHEASPPTCGLSITCSLLHTIEVIGPLENSPLTIGPSCSRGPLHHTYVVPGERVDNLRKSQDGKSALDPPLNPHMSTPRRDLLKRLFGDEPRDASMSMIISCTRSIISSPSSKRELRPGRAQHLLSFSW